MMKCPYCISDISDEASICAHCAHDIGPFKPLISRIVALEEKLSRFDEQEKRWTETESATVPTPVPTSTNTYQNQVLEAIPTEPLGVKQWFFTLLVPLALLLLGHLLITQLWDAREWVLYAVSIAIPLIPGYLLTRRYACGLAPAIFTGFTLAVTAVLGMSAITSLLDASPLLPHNTHEWKELANFWLSIGMSYTAGAILGQVLHSRAKARASMLKLLENPALAKSLGVQTESVQLAMERLDSIAKTALALSASAASVYSGLGRFIGN